MSFSSGKEFEPLRMNIPWDLVDRGEFFLLPRHSDQGTEGRKKAVASTFTVKDRMAIAADERTLLVVAAARQVSTRTVSRCRAEFYEPRPQGRPRKIAR